jgi:gas vesicle protein
MGEDPDAIRDEIVDTRKRMGETIDALGYKADVKSRAKDSVSDKVGSVKERLGMAGQRASDATPDAEEVKHQVRRAAGLAQENPLGLAVGAAAVGFLVGLAVPSSDVEHEKLGPVADRVKDQAKETGQEALDRGKEVAQSAAQTVSEEGRKHGDELADSARENAASLRE